MKKVKKTKKPKARRVKYSKMKRETTVVSARIDSDLAKEAKRKDIDMAKLVTTALTLAIKNKLV